MRTLICAGLLFIASAAAAFAAPSDPQPLWPNGAPGATGTKGADTPSLQWYPVHEEDATALCVIVVPGGGYGGLALDHEGTQIAEWLNSHGILACVLRYRHAPGYGHPYPLMDIQRAIRTVRERAPDSQGAIAQIGILGFSAGGHLCATAATQFDAGKADDSDPTERVSSRPDFAILGYPVITMTDPHTHAGSRRNLLGDAPTPAQITAMSAEHNVTAETPPVFLFHSTDDAVVPVQNSLLFYEACVKAGVPAEMHIFRSGPHGFGLGKENPSLSQWPDLCLAWMRQLPR